MTASGHRVLSGTLGQVPDGKSLCIVSLTPLLIYTFLNAGESEVSGPPHRTANKWQSWELFPSTKSWGILSSMWQSSLLASWSMTLFATRDVQIELVPARTCRRRLGP